MRALDHLAGEPWALQRRMLDVWADIDLPEAHGLPEAQGAGGARADAGGDARGGLVAVIPIFGFLAQRMNLLMAFFGGTSTQRVAAQLRQAMAEPAVKAVVLDVSSPGGSVYGITELATEIREARASKPIVAVANSFAASAAYWLAASAHELVVTPSGEVGSVGVYAIHEDRTEADAKEGLKREIISAGDLKADQVDGAPLSEEGRAALQSKVNHYYGLFVKDVAVGRGVSADVVRDSYGKGLTLTAPQALKAGMVDRIATLEETLARLSSPAGRRAATKAEADGEAELRLRRARATV